MGSLVAAMASSHAFAFMDPSKWEEFRLWNRGLYKQLYGREATTAAALEQERPDENLERYERVQGAHKRLKQYLHALQPDILLVVGDDQNELYRSENIPQIALYNGCDFVTTPDAKPYTSAAAMASFLLERLVGNEFDVSISGEFKENRLISHAHAQILEKLVPDRDIPVIPLFVNGIHVPALEPRRCHALGAALRRIIETDLPTQTRVAVVASGGLSHFTAGYPWKAYTGPYGYGDICVDFDRRLIGAMQRGEGESLARELTSKDLLDHGGIEFRCWLVVLGMVGSTPIEMMAYEPIYRALMGMGVGWWQLQ